MSRTAHNGTQPLQTGAASDSGTASASPDDATLLDQARGGDQAAFAELWERHRHAAFLTAIQVNRQQADDLVSEAFAAIWEQLVRGGGPRESFRAYMLTTVRNLSASWTRVQMREVTGREEGELPLERIATPSPERLYESVEEQRAVLSAFSELPDRYQRVLWLRDVEGLSQLEAAQKLEVTQNAAGLMTMRARESLAAAWLGRQLGPTGSECGPIRKLMPRYVRGTLRARGSAKLEEHLQRCQPCDAQLSRLRERNSELARRLLGTSVLLVAGVQTSTVLQDSSSLAAAWSRAFAAIEVPARKSLAATLAGASSVARRVGWFVTVGLLVTGLGVAPWLLGKGTDDSDRGGSEAPKPTAESEAGAPLPESSDRQERSAAGANNSENHDTLLETDAHPSEVTETLPSVNDGSAGSGEGEEQAGEGTLASAEAPAALVVIASGPAGIAPRLAGTAEPGARVEVRIGAVVRSVVADLRGGWSVDLAAWKLGFGEHSAVVRQRIDGVLDPREVSDSFELTPARYRAVEREPEPGAQSATLDIAFRGAAQGAVCITAGSLELGRVSLEGSGVGGTLLVVPEGVSKHDLDFHYCDGDRSGPSAQLTLDFWWHSTP